ncbi:MAG: fumarate hydratase, partial [Actinobacteria bacterium]|nr:fumarate hydratase [Actinomycetota bacterium]
MPEFVHQELLPLGADNTDYRKISGDGVETVETSVGTFLRVAPSALTLLSATAMFEIAHFP